ncbi:hypothetical protein JL100_020350 [Skermanella mucosa]|uniref:hypothetical protein n=1 Tax=Skermanella mucosa TaxID=1789672 RepID=UPI00192C907F|nr:hypothetical protein [Skermanella mucosa]UEM19425.1 hypothetical protein JL100_020350 [Skermanella mucosa]
MALISYRTLSVSCRRTADEPWSVEPRPMANEIRAALRDPVPTLPRWRERSRRPSELRRFCEPFADLLCDAVPPRRRVGQIPRSVLRPLWTLLVAERAMDRRGRCASGGEIGAVEIAGLIHRAGRQPDFAERAASAHPDFWNIVDDIRAALILNDRVHDARAHLAAAAATGQCPHWLLDHLAASVAGLSAADPKAADLFVMLVARHRPVARTALEMLDRLADRQETRMHVAGLIDRLAEDVRTRAYAAVPERGPADPLALEAAVRDLTALKLSAGQLAHASAAFDALEADLRALLGGRFLAGIAERISSLVPADRTDLRHPDIHRLRTALAALARSRRLFKALGTLPVFERAVDGVIEDAAGRLAGLAAGIDDLPAEERPAARAVIGDALGALHLVAPPPAFRRAAARVLPA